MHPTLTINNVSPLQVTVTAIAEKAYQRNYDRKHGTENREMSLQFHVVVRYKIELVITSIVLAICEKSLQICLKSFVAFRRVSTNFKRT